MTEPQDSSALRRSEVGFFVCRGMALYLFASASQYIGSAILSWAAVVWQILVAGGNGGSPGMGEMLAMSIPGFVPAIIAAALWFAARPLGRRVAGSDDRPIGGLPDDRSLILTGVAMLAGLVVLVPILQNLAGLVYDVVSPFRPARVVIRSEGWQRNAASTAVGLIVVAFILLRPAGVVRLLRSARKDY